jgi:hypothetical protein
MITVREPMLMPVSLVDLKPTQITVGMREVDIKRKAWRERSREKEREFLGRHMIPVVRGPKDHVYIVDHHHLALALHKEGVKDVLVTTLADLSKLDQAAFWFTMDARNWTHPFDDKGKRCGHKAIPKSLKDLVDDPFRSLAGELRRVGGFAKDIEPFSEFQWADFLRRRIKRAAVDKDFSRALEKALALARSPDADYLPGWCGAAPED